MATEIPAKKLLPYDEIRQNHYILKNPCKMFLFSQYTKTEQYWGIAIAGAQVW